MCVPPPRKTVRCALQGRRLRDSYLWFSLDVGEPNVRMPVSRKMAASPTWDRVMNSRGPHQRECHDHCSRYHLLISQQTGYFKRRYYPLDCIGDAREKRYHLSPGTRVLLALSPCRDSTCAVQLHKGSCTHQSFITGRRPRSVSSLCPARHTAS